MLIKAKWFLDSGNGWIENAVLEIHCGKVVQIRKAKPYEKTHDLGDGVITLGLINCHSHLWLSHFNFNPYDYENFLEWTKEVIKYSDEFPKEGILSILETGTSQLKSFGTYCTLDIEPLWILELCYYFKPKIKLLRYAEILGKLIEPLNEHLILKEIDGLCFHGLHTVTPETVTKVLIRFSNNIPPITMHVAESIYELEFLSTGKGFWNELLTKRGFDTSKFEPFGRSPSKRLLDLGILGPKTILVHCLYLEEEDIQIIKQRDSFICICPRSNLNLHKRLPPLDLFFKYGLKLCLGTDSLASVENLSLWDEMKCLMKNFPHIDPKVIFQMATEGGALALGLGPYSINNCSIDRLIYAKSNMDPKDPYASLIYGFDPKLMKWIGELNGI